MGVLTVVVVVVVAAVEENIMLQMACKLPLLGTFLKFYMELKKCTVETKVKGKVIPLQAWTGPEGPRRLRLPDFKTIGI